MSVSVIIPTHDRSRWLGLTLRTVLWQKDIDLEAIVVDDGSTDDTVKMIAAFADLGSVSSTTSRHGESARVRNHGAEEAAEGGSRSWMTTTSGPPTSSPSS